MTAKGELRPFVDKEWWMYLAVLQCLGTKLIELQNVFLCYSLGGRKVVNDDWISRVYYSMLLQSRSDQSNI
jgi:hypothetical protein